MNAMERLAVASLMSKQAAKADKYIRQMIGSRSRIFYPKLPRTSTGWADSERFGELGDEYKRLLTPGKKTFGEEFGSLWEANKAYHKAEGFKDPLGLFEPDPIVQRSKLQPVTHKRIGETVQGAHMVDQALTEPVRGYRAGLADGAADSLTGGIQNRLGRHKFLQMVRKDLGRRPQTYTSQLGFNTTPAALP